MAELLVTEADGSVTVIDLSTIKVEVHGIGTVKNPTNEGDDT